MGGAALSTLRIVVIVGVAWFAIAAAQLGYRCIAYSPEKDPVAGEVCADLFANDWHDAKAMALEKTSP